MTVMEFTEPTIEALTERLAAMVDHVRGMDETRRAIYIGLLHSNVPVKDLDELADDLLR